MRISLPWVQEFVSLKTQDTQKIQETLTEKSAEVDGILDSASHLENVITGKILEILPHPNADKVRITKTEGENGEVLQIICGAKNIEVGQVVPVAKIGAVLPGDFEIAERKMRGVVSEGMLCSGKELGITEDGEGIMILDSSLPLGKPLAEVLGLGGKALDIDNTAITNRPDLFSQLGFAREFVALDLADWKNSEIQNLQFDIQNYSGHSAESVIGKYDNGTQEAIMNILAKIPSTPLPKKITVTDPEICPVRANIILENVTVAPSPKWMQVRLQEVGIRPINNIVDISNFAMMELGMPLHIFDADTIDGDITMRLSKKGEKIVTLDGEEHELPEGVILQEDDTKIFDLAGIMGGKNTEITEKTTRILVHVPVYDPVRIRKASLALAHRTDAATMYEKRVPNASVLPGMLRTLHLLQELCPNATIVSSLDYKEYIPSEKRILRFPLRMASRILGTNIPKEEVVCILESLEFSIEEDGASSEELLITVPPHRLGDISLPEDIAEEIVRIYGLNALDAQAPTVEMRLSPLSPLRKMRRKVTDFLVAQQFFEILSFSFLGPELLEKCGEEKNASYIEVENPLSSHQSLMRQSLFPRLLEKASENFRHRESFSLFEIGKIFFREEEEKKKEILSLGGICVGKDYAEGKGIVEGLAHFLHIPLRIQEARTLPSYASHGATLLLGKDAIGELFLLSSAVKKAFDLPEKVCGFSLNLDKVVAFPQKHKKILSAPKFPAVEFDISVLTDTETFAEKVLRAVKNTDSLIVHTGILEIFEGEGVPEGKKSVTLRFVFRADDRTLTANDIEALKKKIILALEKKGFSPRF